MILANNPGDYNFVYHGLDHAPWHGWTPVDLVFPFFLFIVGVSIGLAVDREQAREGQWWLLGWHILRRSLILFALGLFYNGFPQFEWSSIRIPGVLQRIAVVYLLACLLHLALSRRAIWWTIAAILLGYWGLMTLMPVPGLGHPSLDREANLVAWLDRLIMRGHLWEYETSWDPEGILSTFPALCIALLGLLAGHHLQSGIRKDGRPLLAWGVLLIFVGLLWDAWYPINKGLCTSSFVVFVSGAAMVALELCHLLADIHGQARWFKPLLVMGMNSLFIYLFSEWLEKIIFLIKVPSGAGEMVNLHTFLYENYFTSWLEPFHASLAWALFFLALQLGAAWLLYAKKIIIRI
jgi:predicted acyltransferase